MARFDIGQMVETREPTIAIDPGLEPGRHRFRLEVINAANVRSAPATAIIEIQRGPVARPPNLAQTPLRAAAPSRRAAEWAALGRRGNKEPS